MAQQPSKKALPLAADLTDKDRREIHDIVANLRQSYVERMHEATVEFHRAQRQLNRASHEVTRLDHHLQRINDFCIKHNIPLED